MARPIRIRSSSPVFTQPTGGPSAAALMDGGAAWRGLADLAGTVHQIAERVTAEEGKTRGAEAVERDPDTGELKLSKLPMPLTAFDVAYRHSALAAYTAESETDRGAALTKMALDNADDPEKFEAAANAYVNSQIANAPGEVKGGLLRAGRQDITQIASGIASKKQARDIQTQKESLVHRLETVETDWINLHGQPGGASTPEAQQLFEQMVSIQRMLSNKTGNPLFGVSDEELESRSRVVQSRAKVEAITGDFRRSGNDAGLATAEAAILDPAIGLTVNEKNTAINRLQAIQSDTETKRRQREADIIRNFNLGSDDILKEFLTTRPTLQQVEAMKSRMNATDYRASIELARGTGLAQRDNPDVIADLVVAIDSVPPAEFRSIVARGMKNSTITTDTGRSLISGNTAAFRDDAPASPYRQGRAFVSNSLDANPFGSGPDFGARKQIQANALREYDAWAAENPNATAEDAQAKGELIVTRYNMLGDGIVVQAIGSPYGFTGGLSAVTRDDLRVAAEKLRADRAAGRVTDNRFLAEQQRLAAWARKISQQEAPRTP